MTDLEAIEALQERARLFARPLQIATGFVTLGVGAVVTCLAIAGQWAMGDAASMKLSVLVGCAGAGVVPFAFNRYIRWRLQGQRSAWIDELVHGEGASRAALEAAFTVDSW